MISPIFIGYVEDMFFYRNSLTKAEVDYFLCKKLPVHTMHLYRDFSNEIKNLKNKL
jgi:hypothetical protein